MSGSKNSILSSTVDKNIPWKPTPDEIETLPTRTKFFSALVWKTNRSRQKLRPGDIPYEEFFNEHDDEMNDIKLASIHQGQIETKCDYAGQYLYSRNMLRYIRLGVEKWNLLPQNEDSKKASRKSLGKYLSEKNIASLLHHRLKSNVVNSIVNGAFKIRYCRVETDIDNKNDENEDGKLVFCGSKGNAEVPLEMVQFSNIYDVCNNSWDDDDPPKNKFTWIRRFKNEATFNVSLMLLEVFYRVKKDEYPLPPLPAIPVTAITNATTNNTNNPTTVSKQANIPGSSIAKVTSNNTNNPTTFSKKTEKATNASVPKSIQRSNTFSTKVINVDDESDKENSMQLSRQRPQPSLPIQPTRKIDTPEFKVVLLGEAGVGKRSFLNHFRVSATKYLPTVGVTISIIHLHTNRGPLQFNVWTSEAGAKMSVFCVQSQAAILMFDKQKSGSYKTMPELYKELEKHTGNIPAAIVGNKVAIERGNVEGKRVASKKKNLQFYDISTQHDYNIEKPFLWLARKLCGDNNLHFVEAPSLPPPKFQHDAVTKAYAAEIANAADTSMPLSDDDDL